MSDEDNAASQRERPMSVSVFRPGKNAERGPQQFDINLSRNIFSEPYPLALFSPARVWESLNAISLDTDHLAGNGLFINPDQSLAGTAFDILRTRISQAMVERGWQRIGITSPTHGCGKSFTAANLAMALARRPGSRTVLLDLDLRRPSLHTLFGAAPLGALRDFLDGSQPLESLFSRVGKTLAIGFNGEAVPDAGDVLHSADATQALEAMETQLDPDITVMDLPPALLSDDVLAMRDKVDAVLVVADGKITTAKDIRACEALFEHRIPLLGIVLNRAQDRGLGRLRYGRD
ncbi:MAG: CpsD/CapB family tyrosine-protein kinase [Pseudotabrizicola sp.]|uniref:CpsD/CapB family tyrosine-protein kinase n=1 Tax=Pseudotabrizicola sp. TaxID=2939647 RepID=UPI002732077B|nr:CpsD/CapB family tyrosine-protein kinase [Pseudotabrizicola sp.]MDP2081857.1 CpsD/CapB family tyrosine-protein kinase [Pseudotabrizicola sp.]MDZ7573853.1 CpsD/CapB family tyrosine-protein kinase [Pseudotabrizicola sp.]